MSAVYLAEDLRHERQVAVKVFGADAAYTIDGSGCGEIEDETDREDQAVRRLRD